MDSDSFLLRMPSDDPPLPVRLHPLVLLKVTRHVGRAQLMSPPRPALGVLLSRAAPDGAADIVSSFEVVHSDSGAVDWPAVRLKREQLALVTPELSVAGWYGVGATRSAASRCAAVMHAALCEAFGEVAGGVALALMVDAEPPAALARLPSHIFRAALRRRGTCGGQQPQGEEKEKEQKEEKEKEEEEEEEEEASGGGRCIVSAVEGREDALVCLTKVSFALESDEMEQVGMDAAMNGVAADRPAAPSNAPQLRRMEQSLRMLRQRIALVAVYLEEVESGRITQPDHTTLRHIAKVCAMLPSSIVCDEVHTGISEEVTHTLMATLLALQTKCALSLSELASAKSRPV